MLLVLFDIGKCRYGLNSDDIIEIIPAIQLNPIPGTPKFVKGIFNYHDTIVPTVDISQVTLNKPANILLNTRIAIVKIALSNKKIKMLGLLCENMTEILDINESDFQEPGIEMKVNPHLGPIIKHNNKFIQYIKIEKLISEELQSIIYS